MELTDHHRWIYHDPSIGGDDPGTDFDDYLATPERIASWVAELAGSVVGLTGVFKPGRTSRRNRSSLPAGAVRKSANSSSEESFRKPARGYEYLAIRQPAARNISTIRECYDAGFRTRPGFRLRHDAQRQLVEAGRRSWMRLHRAELDVLRVSSCVAPLRGPASILGRRMWISAPGREDVDKCSRPGFPGFEVVRA